MVDSRITPTARPRLDSVDLLRGIVMVVMALDHVRDFFSDAPFDPTDLARTTAPLFVTRWVTHFCAPVFCFLAGTSAFLTRKTKSELARFLLTRGLWLLVLEVTVVHVGWFGPDYTVIPLITIWALGVGMIALAPMVLLPTWAVGAIGLAIIAGHNAFDRFHGGGDVWKALHDGGRIAWRFRVGYPALPWVGVMAAGYAFGPVLKMDTAARRRWLVGLGAGCLALFVALRGPNLYGETEGWRSQPSALFTLFSFINCRKYPPSLDYLLVTLGPSLLALAALDGVRAKPGNPFLIFGRVPMFYYIVHLYLIHLATGLVFFPRYGLEAFRITIFQKPPGDFGVSLPVVYALWLLAVALLYFPCRWYARVKQRSASAWLSYL